VIVFDRDGVYALVIDIKPYYDWLDAPAVAILDLPAIRSWNRAHKQSGLKRARSAETLADVLERSADELMSLASIPGTTEEQLHQWLNKPEHYVFLDAYADEVRSKVAFGAVVSDFVIRRSDKTYVLVELESASCQLFRSDNGEPSAAFNHACTQVRDWRRYVRDNVYTVRHELGLDDIYEPAGMVVAGLHVAPQHSERWRTMKSDWDLSLATYDELAGRVRSLARKLRAMCGVRRVA